MPRSPNNLRPKKNPSEEKLRATPFSSVAELDAEARSIRLSVWRKFNEAQVIHELLSKPENEFILEEWRNGLDARIDDGDPSTRMFRIYSDGQGLKLELNKSFTATLGDHEARFFEGVVRAGIEGFGSLYMRAKSIISPPDRGVSDFDSGSASVPVAAARKAPLKKKPR
jgi:hypothetical protein